MCVCVVSRAVCVRGVGWECGGRAEKKRRGEEEQRGRDARRERARTTQRNNTARHNTAAHTEAAGQQWTTGTSSEKTEWNGACAKTLVPSDSMTFVHSRLADIQQLHANYQGESSVVCRKHTHFSVLNLILYCVIVCVTYCCSLRDRSKGADVQSLKFEGDHSKVEMRKM